MPRDLPVGNGKVLINFDKEYSMRDIYYPHVGQENHTTGKSCYFGIWLDGEFSWINNNPDWQISRKYMKETLVSDVSLKNEKLALEIQIHDLVDYVHDLFIKEIRIKNLREKTINLRLFFHQNYSISENDVGDTAFYDPETNSVIHYKKNRWFLNNCSGVKNGLEQWATGKKAVAGMEGTWKDAEDGILGANPIAQGSVDSTIACSCQIEAKKEAQVHYWIAFGQTYEEVFELNKLVKEKTPHYFVPRNQNYWRLWVNQEQIDFQNLPSKIIELYKRSLLVIRTQIDQGGAIIAANDHDIVQFARDTYSYMWPRDGALVACSLSKAGYRDPVHNFFRFCASVLKNEGYLLHKYNPDRTLASSWHPWYRNGQKDLPIQEDETALVIWSLWQHFRKHRDVEFVRPLFESLIVKAAEFMLTFRDETSKLPLPSHDLWEERYGVHLFTVASVIAGLKAAASFSQAFGEITLHDRYENAASEMTDAMLKYMWSDEHNRFCRMAKPNNTGLYDLDMTIDASMYAIFAFGVLPANNTKVKNTMKAIKDRLSVKTEVGGIARYENDYYHQISQDTENVAGNPWFICSLWMAQYHIASAQSPESLKEALNIFEWVSNHALESGILAEQVHPYTNEPLSVSPLTWSHATFVLCIQEYLEKRKLLMSEAVFAHTISPV